MSKRVGFTMRGLDEWQRGLLAADKGGVERMKDRILRTAGLRTLEILQDSTPVKTGRLRASMSMGHADNIFEMQVGKKSYVLVGTAVAYAAAVNDGYKQKAGRFVPGYWKGDTFVYEPGSKTGMVLTGKVIEGARMFEAAMQGIQEDMPDIVEFEFRRLYRELFG
jgi:hypothetical protein